MILSDKSIKESLRCRELEIVGELPLYIGPSSVDLHLDNKALILKKDSAEGIHFDQDPSDRFQEYNDWEEITIYPGEFYLLHTKEWIKFPRNIAGFIQGRSSIARLGINIHAAGFFDPGFCGTATLEVTNFTQVPITIPAGTRIAQMVFMEVDKDVMISYAEKKDSKYQGQKSPVISKINKDYGARN